MIEFDDLTPVTGDETEQFYDLQWWLKYTYYDLTYTLHYRVTDKLFHSLICPNRMITDPSARRIIQQGYTTVGCLLRKGHKGPCLCYHPEYGIISRQILKVAEPENLA